ncbi:hypothetical protein [Cryobacterium sp. SO1]|uniref:hypothetical protein n=1 Tax=Cryobacterium sp. SO1 TaxID=1897061 RepID=UPI001022ED64|nr:hypothetical protein [Cryobacterium sp. SO1]RZI35313.1 hypothetical protein BJQ95_02380 [Cryobacterium sp. SO1]
MAETNKIDIATVYLHVIPSFEGIEQSIGQQFGVPARQAGERAGDSAGQGFGSKFAAKGKLVAAAGAIAIGAAVMAGFNASMDAESGNNKLTAQLGLSPAESAKYGKIAGQLYTSNYGESMGDVNAGIDAVASTLVKTGKIGESALEGTTAKAMSFASAFDTDVSEAVNGVGVLIDSGLATNADQAFDLMTASAQRVPSAMRGEFAPMVDEYSKHFANLGLTGAQSMSLLVAASQTGAVGMDKTGDALKEFTILATDGSASSIAAFESIGLNASQMASDIAGGGPAAAEALSTTAAALLKIEDPAARAQASIALFGAPMEDMGIDQIPKFLTSLDGGADGMKDFAGTAAELDKTMGGGAAASISGVTRGLQKLMTDAITPLLPAVSSIIGFISDHTWIIGVLAGVVLTALVPAMVAWASATWATTAAFVASPLGLVVIGVLLIIAAIVALVVNWDIVIAFIKTTLAGFIDWIFDGLTGLSIWFGTIWQGILDTAAVIWGAIGAFLKAAWDAIVAIFMAVHPVGIIISHWDQIMAFTSTVWTNVSNFISGIWNGIISGISTGVGNVLGFVFGMGNSIGGFFVGLVETAKSWGSNILGGLLDGLKAMGGKVTSFFGDLLPSWVTAPFAEALDIHSPSRVFFRLGEHTGDGFLGGTSSKKDLIEKSMQSLVTIPTVQSSAIAPARSAEGGQSGTGDTFEIHPSAGMDETLLAQKISTANARKKRF